MSVQDHRNAQEFGVADKSAVGFSVALGVAAVAVAGLTAAMVAGIDEARKFQVEVAKFTLMGMSDATNREAQSFAESMKVIGTSATEAMRLVLETQGIFRESGKEGPEALRSAEMFAPYMAKMDFVNKALNGESAAKLYHENQAMLRFIDMMGGNVSGARAQELIEFGWKLTESTGGNVDWEKLRQFRQYGKTAASGLTPEAMAKLEPMIQEFKGNAGTSLSTAYMRLNGLNRPPNQATHEMVSSGLWDPTAVIWNKMGGIKQFKPGRNPLVDSELFASDPVEWYIKHIVPLYAERHYTEAQKYRENSIFFGGTGGNLFNAIDRQLSVVPGALASYQKAKSLDEAVKIAGGTVDGKIVDATAQWQTLMKDIGDHLLPNLNRHLKDLVMILKWIDGLFTSKNETVNASIQGGLGSVFGGGLSGLFGGNAVPPAKSQSVIQLDHTTNLDGLVLSKTVTKYQVDGMDRMPSSGSFPDLRMSPITIGP